MVCGLQNRHCLAIVSCFPSFMDQRSLNVFVCLFRRNIKIIFVMQTLKWWMLMGLVHRHVKQQRAPHNYTARWRELSNDYTVGIVDLYFFFVILYIYNIQKCDVPLHTTFSVPVPRYFVCPFFFLYFQTNIIHSFGNQII